MAYLIAQGPSREAEATGRELARLPYSRSSFERCREIASRVWVIERGALVHDGAPADVIDAIR